MYKKHDKLSKHNKRIIIVTVVLIIFSTVTLITGRTPTTIESIFKDTITNIEYYVIKTPIQFFGSLIDEYTSLKDAYEENAILKPYLDKYAREEALNEVLSSELNQLKEITEIDYLPTDYKVKYTSVIARDVESWSDEITINLGDSSGIKEGMAVMSSKGMIGTVTKVNAISSTVSLLTSENPKSQLPVMIMSGEDTYYGLLDSYDIESQCYKITMLSDVEKIEKDAKVVTSGLGGSGKSPKGILVGTVESFSTKGEMTQSVCLVKPSADFDSMNYVAVEQRVN